MKITKIQLRRIIKEEKAKLISEQPGSYGQTILDDLTIQVGEIIERARYDAAQAGEELTREQIVDHITTTMQELR